MKANFSTIIPILFATLLSACLPASNRLPPSPALIDTDYILALSVANRFLSAWQNRDQDVGIAVLSNHLLQSRSEEGWRMAISGISNPHHQAYEITNGRRLRDGRFAFTIRLYNHYTGFKERAKSRGTPSTIILVKTGKEQWRVDELPEM